jgi:hypothetical protein
MCERTEGEGILILRGEPIPHRRTNGSIIGPGYSSSSATFAMWIFEPTLVVTGCAPPQAFSREVKAKVPRRVAFSSHAHDAAVKYEGLFRNKSEEWKRMCSILHMIRMD